MAKFIAALLLTLALVLPTQACGPQLVTVAPSFVAVPTNAFLVNRRPFVVNSAFGQNTFIREERGLFGGLRSREIIQSNGFNNNVIIQERRGLFGFGLFR